MGLALVTVVGLAGFPQANAFFLATPRVGASGAAREFRAGREAGTCRGRQERVLMSSEGAEEDASKPQYIRSPEMDTTVKEIIPPPDREAAMKMVAARESEEIAKGELGDYYSADVPDLPKPPYFFQVPGEFGNDTLCTDPDWHTALLALTWLGVPVEVQHEEDEEEPMLLMANEVYDDPKQLLGSLPERSLLSDFVESLPPITNCIKKVEKAWMALHYSKDGKDPGKLEESLNESLKKVENILVTVSSKGRFVEGGELTVGDLSLAITTYHMLAAFGLEKQWKVPVEMKKLKAHMEMMHEMQMFKMWVPAMSVLEERYALPK